MLAASIAFAADGLDANLAKHHVGETFAEWAALTGMEPIRVCGDPAHSKPFCKDLAAIQQSGRGEITIPLDKSNRVYTFEFTEGLLSKVTSHAAVTAASAVEDGHRVANGIVASTKTKKPLAPLPAEARFKVIVGDSEEFYASSFGIATPRTAVASSSAGVRKFTITIMKALSDNCPMVTVTNKAENADYFLRLERNKTFSIAVFDKSGDMVFVDTTDTIQKDVKRFCAALPSAGKTAVPLDPSGFLLPLLLSDSAALNAKFSASR